MPARWRGTTYSNGALFGSRSSAAEPPA